MRVSTLLLLLIAAPAPAPAAEAPRARPPEFTAEDRAAFFDDALATLVGPRPQAGAATPTEERSGSAATASTAAWSDLVAPDVLETEVKRQASALAKTTRSASAYKAGGFRDATDALGVIATLFAVTAEHSGQPRWRDEAAALRGLFAAGMTEADAATDAAYAAAADRSADLQDLVRGGRPATPEAEPTVDWSQLASRSTLMRRMEAAEGERLRGWVASERALARNAEDARHEAQVLALLAEAILRPEADDHDDPDYQAYARRLRVAAGQLAAAAEAEDQPAAAAAMTEVSRSCVDCHADYRG
ncbi:Cytochrome C' [Botrimarina colliarenosi]|uniref:Cytochrome C n=1 Tax=Botrimarina colliarenosi TaxID=2528001 RepID=A0A5C6AKW2_9BACT|nr:cytochrome c [Botrimarina colliarenosi]TWT99898.1 Cytochrome C' [Botrimarina colliarenosi]